jgi:hypothetical protein
MFNNAVYCKTVCGYHYYGSVKRSNNIRKVVKQKRFSTPDIEPEKTSALFCQGPADIYWKIRRIGKINKAMLATEIAPIGDMQDQVMTRSPYDIAANVERQFHESIHTGSSEGASTTSYQSNSFGLMTYQIV